MELTELENILRRCDEAITENVRLNRNTVKILLTNKAEMRLNKEPIGRPRQIYVGKTLRAFEAIENR